jgi:hypothetical protein
MLSVCEHSGVVGLLAALVVASNLLSGCGTKKQTYNAPDPAEVREATRQVKEGIKLSRFDVGEARKHIEAAQKSADEISTLSLTLLQKVDQLAAIAPIELQKPIGAIRLDVQDLTAKDTVLTSGLAQAWQHNDAAETHLTATDAHEVELEQKQKVYYANAWKLADTATDLNARLVDVEKKLSWYRWHWWASWTVLVAGIFVCAVAAFLKWGAKWTAKATVAAGRFGI